VIAVPDLLFALLKVPASDFHVTPALSSVVAESERVCETTKAARSGAIVGGVVIVSVEWHPSSNTAAGVKQNKNGYMTPRANRAKIHFFGPRDDDGNARHLYDPLVWDVKVQKILGFMTEACCEWRGEERTVARDRFETTWCVSESG
jgi:hypothetical protein